MNKREWICKDGVTRYAPKGLHKREGEQEYVDYCSDTMVNMYNCPVVSSDLCMCNWSNPNRVADIAAYCAHRRDSKGEKK